MRVCVVSLLAFPTLALAQPLTVEAIVAKAEPAIACVIVSRSDAYRKIFPTTKKAEPGQLGGFDSHAAEHAIGKFATDLPRELRRQSFLQKYDLANADYFPEAFGTGLVIDRQGLVLTNYHVVQDATKVFVRLPGGKGSYCDIIAADPRCDLAVLKPIDRLPPLTPITFGDGGNVRRGQQVIALANPFAAGRTDGQPSVSVGVIGNLQRRVAGRQIKLDNEVVPFDQFGILLQTDARIALGSSGGALLNMQGECIGITTSLAAIAGGDAPGGFAVPVNAGFRKMIDVLKRGEEVDYGLLGVIPKNAEGTRGGAELTEAQLGSPANLAGLRAGDVIVSVGDVPIHDRNDLLLNLGLYFAGDKVSLGYVRGGKEHRTEATLVKYRISDRSKIIATSLGARPIVGGLRVDYTSLRTHNRVDPFQSIPPGVLVTEVQEGSKAERLSILKGDSITHVAGVEVNTPAAFYEQIARHNTPIDLTVVRGDEKVRVRW